MKTPEIQIGLESDKREKMMVVLRRFLANTYVLYAKTQVFHWNVEGLIFHSLHEMFEEQYQNLAKQVDDVAERLRALGYKTPNGLKDLLAVATIQESSADLKAPDMLKMLLEDHEMLCRQLREDIEMADEVDDAGTEDFLTSLLAGHEKTAWMLRSSIA
jgi:starvation-inducible DNA-binding protein